MATAPVGPGGFAQRRAGAARRRRVRAVRLLRLRHRHADLRPPGRGRRPLQQLPHDGALLPHPGVPADRAQPPRQRHGPHRRVRRRVPRLRRDDAEDQRVPLRGPDPQRLRHLRRRQVAPGAGAGDGDGCQPGALAARPRVRSLLRVPRRRDRPVPPRSRPRQPPGRPARLARGGLPPHRGPRRPGDGLPQGPAGVVAHQAVLPLLHAGRLPRPAPGAQGVRRPVPRPVRSRLGRLARGDLRPAAGVRAVPRGHDPERAAAVGQGVGRAHRRRAPALRADDGGLRRVPRAHRRAGRPSRRLHRVAGRARQHDRARDERQRRQRRGRTPWVVQRELLLQPRAGEPRGEPGPHRRPRRAPCPQPLPVGLGVGRELPAAALEAGDPRGRRDRPADLLVAAGHERGPAPPATSTSTPST